MRINELLNNITITSQLLTDLHVEAERLLDKSNRVDRIYSRIFRDLSDIQLAEFICDAQQAVECLAEDQPSVDLAISLGYENTSPAGYRAYFGTFRGTDVNKIKTKVQMDNGKRFELYVHGRPVLARDSEGNVVELNYDYK